MQGKIMIKDNERYGCDVQVQFSDEIASQATIALGESDKYRISLVKNTDNEGNITMVGLIFVKKEV